MGSEFHDITHEWKAVIPRVHALTAEGTNSILLPYQVVLRQSGAGKDLSTRGKMLCAEGGREKNGDEPRAW